MNNDLPNSDQEIENDPSVNNGEKVYYRQMAKGFIHERDLNNEKKKNEDHLSMVFTFKPSFQKDDAERFSHVSKKVYDPKNTNEDLQEYFYSRFSFQPNATGQGTETKTKEDVNRLTTRLHNELITFNEDKRKLKEKYYEQKCPFNPEVLKPQGKNANYENFKKREEQRKKKMEDKKKEDELKPKNIDKITGQKLFIPKIKDPMAKSIERKNEDVYQDLYQQGMDQKDYIKMIYVPDNREEIIEEVDNKRVEKKIMDKEERERNRELKKEREKEERLEKKEKDEKQKEIKDKKKAQKRELIRQTIREQLDNENERNEQRRMELNEINESTKPKKNGKERGVKKNNVKGEKKLKIKIRSKSPNNKLFSNITKKEKKHEKLWGDKMKSPAPVKSKSKGKEKVMMKDKRIIFRNSVVADHELEKNKVKSTDKIKQQKNLPDQKVSRENKKPMSSVPKKEKKLNEKSTQKENLKSAKPLLAKGDKLKKGKEMEITNVKKTFQNNEKTRMKSAKTDRQKLGFEGEIIGELEYNDFIKGKGNKGKKEITYSTTDDYNIFNSGKKKDGKKEKKEENKKGTKSKNKN